MVLDPPVRKLMCLAALVVSCATVDEIRLPWMQEPDAAAQARDEQEEQRRIEQRLKAIEQATAPRVAPPPPPPPPLRQEAADPFAEDEVLAAEAAVVEDPVELVEVEEPAPTKPSHARSAKSRPAAVEAPPPVVVERECCRYCDVGKPCGNTCIARNKTCRVGRGCAC